EAADGGLDAADDLRDQDLARGQLRQVGELRLVEDAAIDPAGFHGRLALLADEIQQHLGRRYRILQREGDRRRALQECGQGLAVLDRALEERVLDDVILRLGLAEALAQVRDLRDGQAAIVRKDRAFAPSDQFTEFADGVFFLWGGNE